jgi:hypothetical protein
MKSNPDMYALSPIITKSRDTYVEEVEVIKARIPGFTIVENCGVFFRLKI